MTRFDSVCYTDETRPKGSMTPEDWNMLLEEHCSFPELQNFLRLEVEEEDGEED